MVNKTLRSSETREKTSRKKGWTRPSSLDAPPAPDGYKHRWIRESVRGFDDNKNVMGKLREGWELVRADEYPDWQLPTIEDGKHAGVIGVGGLLLARMPVEIVEERNEHYENQTRSQMQSVDNNLMRENDPRMPLFNERTTKVTNFGKGT